MEEFKILPKPEKVFEIFSAFSKIPHGSGNTAQATDFCLNFAEALGLSAESDNAGNVIIRKPASKGFENRSPLILQGHLDMVCEKTADKEIDFLKDGLSLYRDGDFLFADRTTLGGDDGIAVAIILALLCEKDLKHPPLEVVFTTDEETGMDGARALDTSKLNGKTMINLDSEDENTLWVSCAGGARVNTVIPVTRTSPTLPYCAEITLSGLCGGHSGTEINKGRLNAVKELSRFIADLNNIQLAEFFGGMMDNAIPREATAFVFTDNITELKQSALKFENELKLLSKNDRELSLTVTKSQTNSNTLTNESKNAVFGFINASPNGVIAMSRNIEGLTETSLNLGIMRLDEKQLHVSFAVRSSVDAKKEELCDRLCECSRKFGGSCSVHGEYPAWEYNETSRVRDIISAQYESINGRKCEIKAIHAGLECGIFYNKIKGLDCVSFGPNIYDIHTPEEKLSVSSVKRVYELLKAVLPLL